MKVLGGKNPTLYSYEKSLPFLPVPDLDATTKRVTIFTSFILHFSVFYLFKLLTNRIR